MLWKKVIIRDLQVEFIFLKFPVLQDQSLQNCNLLVELMYVHEMTQEIMLTHFLTL